MILKFIPHFVFITWSIIVHAGHKHLRLRFWFVIIFVVVGGAGACRFLSAVEQNEEQKYDN